MFGWLTRLWRPAAPVIRTVDDLAEAIKTGVIKPHVYREGAVQIADPFAETGLSLRERKKVMLRSTGVPAGIRMYVHRHCSADYLSKLTGDRVVFEPQTETWTPLELIGKFPDVTHCDECGQQFQPGDEGYLAYLITSKEQLELLEEVRREQTNE